MEKKIELTNSGKSQELYVKAKKLIPGGTQLLSKRPEMFLPDFWPAYYKEAKGCEVWDLDGNKYIDMSFMSVGACILGYVDEDVNAEVTRVINTGNMTTLNAPEEVELAEVLCEMHPWADMVRYSRTGGESMAIAVRIARAKSQKDKVLFCGYHGWHDWYLAANLSDDKALDGHLLPGLEPAGVPRCLKGSAHPFVYNDTKGFVDLLNEHKDEVGVVVIESIRNEEPKKEFLQTIQQMTKDLGIVLVVDEISAGWRLTQGGAHLLFDLEPDIAVFGKGMSNGYPMGAIIGRREVMEAAQNSFISSTYWTDKIGSAAALKTIEKMKEVDVPTHLSKIGKMVQEGWASLAENTNIKLKVGGIYPFSNFVFDNNHLELKTLYTQLMLEKGFLATNACIISFAHKEEHVNKYMEAVDEVFGQLAKIVEEGDIKKYLKSKESHSGFKRLT
jgi:glutamate-1-semialdehyde 2,1-aminomutase